MTKQKARTYSSYLHIDELLALQQPTTGEHDEVLFIVIHQIYELWFKEMLHEVDRIVALLGEFEVTPALHTFKRILTILKTLVAQLDVLETMTPLEFLSFRDRLESASGFQSAQFRELEFSMGQKDPSAIERFDEGSRARTALERRFAEPSLWDVFLACLVSGGHSVPEEALQRDVTKPVESSESVQAVLVRVYRDDPGLRSLCERLVDFDEGLMEWRYRHVMMVRRTIGTRMGTGGSDGAAYLQRTLFRPCFPDLWAIRAEL